MAPLLLAVLLAFPCAADRAWADSVQVLDPQDASAPDAWRALGIPLRASAIGAFPTKTDGNQLIVTKDIDPLLQGHEDGDWTARGNFHVHSTCSDGMLGPEAVVQHLYKEGVRVMALTDHDSLDCLIPAAKAASDLGMRLIAGVEISAGPGVHILAYGFDPTHPALAKVLATNREQRHKLAVELVDNLNRLPQLAKRGVTITIQEVEAVAAGAPIGRPHVAQVLVNKGLVANKDQAFYTLFLYAGRAGALAAKDDAEDDEENDGAATPEDVVSAVKAAGGLTFLAHPYTIKAGDEEVQRLLALGMAGIEAYRPVYARTEEGVQRRNGRLKKYLGWADERKLVVVGGSDFHGFDTKQNAATISMPKNLLWQFWTQLQNHVTTTAGRPVAPAIPH